MYFGLGISLALALLLILNIFLSAATSCLWRILSPLLKYFSAGRKAQFIFSLRVFPLICSAILVFGFLLPAYFLHEPYSTSETVNFELALIATISFIGFCRAFYRIFVGWQKTRKLTKDWLKNAEPIAIENIDIPVFCISHPFPVMAVVGIFRPQMFVARQVLESLSSEEFHAAVVHEAGHLIARDNFKRTFLRVCRDLLMFPLGRKLDSAWAENAESSADEYAVQNNGNQTTLDLASALIKIARIIPKNTTPVMPSGAFYIDAKTESVSVRIHHLLNLAETDVPHSNLKLFRFRFGISTVFYLGCIFTAITFVVTDHSFLKILHDNLERIINFLQ
jgi:Zn-dependent protease with chaperone function